MENFKDNEIENYRVLLRFSLSQSNYSCQIPRSWTVKMLKNFILHSFKNELRNNFTLIYCGKILHNEDQVISSILKKEELLNQIFVTIKNEGAKQESKLEKNLKDSKKFDITQTAAFQLAEKGLILNALEKLANLNVNGNSAMANNHFINQNVDVISRMPLFSSQLKDRVAFETRKNRLNIFSFEDTIIENYPLRDYFKFEILFKLIMFFILFGFQIKGYNLPIFISLLVLYYWYNVYTDVKAYYNKKEEAIKQYIKETDPKLLEQESEENSEYESEDEKSELNMSPEQNINQQENIIVKNDLNIEPKAENELINTNIEMSDTRKLSKEEPLEMNVENTFKDKLANNGLTNIDKINQFFDSKITTENTDKLDKNEEDIKIENEKNNLINETENLINTENTQAVNRKMSENLNSEINAAKAPIMNEMKDIAPILEKFEKKKKKKENVPEGPIRYFVTFFFEVIFTFFLSLIPAWSDEFENNHPIIHNAIEANNNVNQNNNTNALNNNEQNQNNENQDNLNNQSIRDGVIQEEAKEDFTEKNIRNLNEGQFNKYNEYEDTQFIEQEQQFNENNSLQFKRITLKETAEIKENERQMLDSNSLSERLYNKSANDKILNSEMEPVRRKIIVNDDFGSKNENEFVFPENLNLDNLSYNEAFMENNKKKINEEDHNKMN